MSNNSNGSYSQIILCLGLYFKVSLIFVVTKIFLKLKFGTMALPIFVSNHRLFRTTPRFFVYCPHPPIISCLAMIIQSSGMNRYISCLNCCMLLNKTGLICSYFLWPFLQFKSLLIYPYFTLSVRKSFILYALYIKDKLVNPSAGIVLL